MIKKKQNLSGKKTNAEIEAKMKCEKSLEEQLEIMEEYTKKHQETLGMPRDLREIQCLKVIYPRLLRKIEKEDLFAGRMDYLPVGFGCVTSVGGVGHYCHFYNMEKFRDELSDADMVNRVDKLIAYWEEEDTKTKFMNRYTDGIINTVYSSDIMYDAPVSTGARLSGMMLNYNKLVDKGIVGIKKEIISRMDDDCDNSFYKACIETLDLFTSCCDFYIEELKAECTTSDEPRTEQLNTIIDSLSVIRTEPPTNFHQALQLVWMYALLAGVINYGRLDDIVGEYLQKDLDEGNITFEKAKAYVKSIWTLIENKRTTVNGRVIVGGRGRKNPAAADTFARIALEVCNECRYVEPQFTLRLYEDTPQDIYDKALECLASGATYPTLYNDEVHVPGLMNCMRINEKEAEQYAPFGCGEMNIVGMTVSPPNSIINLTKTLNIVLNEGVDPWDNVNKAGPIKLKKLEDINSFEEFYEEYRKLHDYYAEICVDGQINSYKIMNEEVSFLFNSILMDDCLEKGKALLDGGIKYLGGCCETFGNINCSDSIYAIKKLVFDDKKYTLREINNALVNDFKGYERLQKDLKDCPKYGNDYKEVDEVANMVYETSAKTIRRFGIEKGLKYYGIVIINNQANTEWGLKTSASADGRNNKVFLNPSNNPQGGADKNGPTAMLNSLSKFDSRYHLGSVQNIKFQTNFFKENMDKIKMLFKTYFKHGGCQLMVTVVDKHALEDAMIHPENYPNLIVRVSGFSAVFVNLDRSVQEELLSRTLYEGA